MSTIAQLLARQGEIAAQGARAQGELWGGLASGLGQIGGQAVQAHAEQKELAKRDARMQQILGSDLWQRDPQSAYQATVSTMGPQLGPRVADGMLAALRLSQGQAVDPADTQKQLQILAGGFLALPEPLKAGAWGGVRQVAQRVGMELPEAYSPELAPAIQQFAGGAAGAPKTREVKFRNPDGSESIQIVEDKPGQMFTSAPEPPKHGDGSYTLGTNEVRFGPDGRVIARGPAAQVMQHGAPQADLSGYLDGLERGDFGIEAVPASARAAVLSEAGKRGLDTRTSKQREIDSGAEAVLTSLAQLKAQAAKTMTSEWGPEAKVVGGAQRVGSWAGLAPETQLWDSQAAKLAMFARELGEKGVLTDRDVERVAALLPAVTDPVKIRDKKLADIEEILTASLNGKVSSRVKLGRRPSQPTTPGKVGRFTVQVED